MKKILFGFFVVAVGLGIVLGDVPQVFAQESETEEFTLEEITVTAQKREENQQKVPIAMEVISGEDLASLGRDNVDEILKNISNIFINTTADGQRISLRGITDDSMSSEDQHLAESVVAVNVDGSYNNMDNVGQNLFDIERVEVLFGPQSTMYGSNAPGGIVNVITASPKTDRYSANASVEYGSYELLNLQGVLNVPVYRDRIAMRAAVNRSEQGSFVGTDSLNETTSVRLRGLYQASDDLSFTLTGNWSKRSNAGQTGGSVVPFANQDNVADPWTSAGADEFGRGNVFDQVTNALNGNFDWNTRFGAISLVPSYSESSSEGHGTRAAGGPGGPGGPPPGPPPGGMSLMSGSFALQQAEEEEEELIGYWQEDSNKQKGAELRMTNATDFEWFEWILGGTYFNSEQKRESLLEDEAGTYSYGETIQKQKALYGNITYPLWFYREFALTLGYRQSWAKNYLTSVGGGREETRGNKEGFSEPDWKYGFEYNPADHLMFYGNFASSYRQPSAGGGGGPGMISKAEILDSYTAGMKSRWLGNKLQVNVSAFFYDYANKLQSGFKVAENITEYYLGFIDNNNNGVWDPGIDEDYASLEWNAGRGQWNAVAEPDGQYPTINPDTGEVAVFTANEPTAQGFGAFQSLGLDLQTSVIITSKDRMNLSISYLNSEWIDLHFDFTWDMIFPDEDYYGITPVNSPEWSMAYSYEHTFTLGEYGTLTSLIDMQYKSEYTMLWDVLNNEEARNGYQEPYVLYDVSASFYHYSGKWNLNAYIKNITNYAVKRSYHGMTGNRQMRLGDPRTYAVSFSIKF